MNINITNACKKFVTIRVFLLLTRSATLAPIGPKNIVGSAYETHRSAVAIEEPVASYSLARSKKFIMFNVNCENICDIQSKKNLVGI